ncbi:MAG: RNA-binding cell elongation regulator Jag/EloR [Bacilli bacterium]
MEKITKEGKVFEEVLGEILKENHLEEKDVFYKQNEKKGGLFKGSTIEVIVYKKDDVYHEIEDYLKEIITGLGLEVSFELKKSDEQTVIKMYSNNNPLLIGKNGQTLRSLEVLVKQMIHTKYNMFVKIVLDVENYKEKKDAFLERFAKQMANDVVRTNTEIHLDNMTSYERRIIHNALTNFSGVTAESEGEEPNRHIVIKPSK